MYVRHKPQETVHQFWSRFLLVKNKIKYCCDDDAVSVFCRNSTDEGILNALNRHRILHFTDLAHIVQNTAQWKALGKLRQPDGILLPLSSPPYGLKGCTLTGHPIITSLTRESNPPRDIEPSLTNCSTSPIRYTLRRIPNQHIAFGHVGYSGRWLRAARPSSLSVSKPADLG